MDELKTCFGVTFGFLFVVLVWLLPKTRAKFASIISAAFDTFDAQIALLDDLLYAFLSGRRNKKNE